MSEYIEREAALQIIDYAKQLTSEQIVKESGTYELLSDTGKACYDGIITTLAMCKRLINEAVIAADVKPEIHAYWIRGKEFGFKTHNPMWYCSNCGGGIRYNTTLRTYEKHKKPVEEVNCFCRKCGAKMDLEPIYEREES